MVQKGTYITHKEIRDEKINKKRKKLIVVRRVYYSSFYFLVVLCFSVWSRLFVFNFNKRNTKKKLHINRLVRSSHSTSNHPNVKEKKNAVKINPFVVRIVLHETYGVVYICDGWILVYTSFFILRLNILCFEKKSIFL